MTVKRFVVMCLACFDTPTETQHKVRQEFGIVMSRQGVQKYDPTKPSGASLSAELRTLFTQTRERFIDELEKLPLAHRATRLRKLESVYDEAREKGNLKVALGALSAAAREMQPFEFQDVDSADPDNAEESE